GRPTARQARSLTLPQKPPSHAAFWTAVPRLCPARRFIEAAYIPPLGWCTRARPPEGHAPRPPDTTRGRAPTLLIAPLLPDDGRRRRHRDRTRGVENDRDGTRLARRAAGCLFVKWPSNY